MHRYDPVPYSASGAVYVWDRWTHELCLFAFGNPRGMHCTYEALTDARRPKWLQAPVLPDAPFIRQPDIGGGASAPK